MSAVAMVEPERGAAPRKVTFGEMGLPLQVGKAFKK